MWLSSVVPLFIVDRINIFNEGSSCFVTLLTCDLSCVVILGDGLMPSLGHWRPFPSNVPLTTLTFSLVWEASIFCSDPLPYLLGMPQGGATDCCLLFLTTPATHHHHHNVDVVMDTRACGNHRVASKPPKCY